MARVEALALAFALALAIGGEGRVFLLLLLADEITKASEGFGPAMQDQPTATMQALPPAPPMAAPLSLRPPESLLCEDDEKGKVSRWQIGSTSLSVLEQVYMMEPFPGVRRAPGQGKKGREREVVLGGVVGLGPRAEPRQRNSILLPQHYNKPMFKLAE